jgi:hypothetical protein
MDYKNILIGFVSLIIGIYILYDTYRMPVSKLTANTFGAYLGGLTFVIIGFLLIFGIHHI